MAAAGSGLIQGDGIAAGKRKTASLSKHCVDSIIHHCDSHTGIQRNILCSCAGCIGKRINARNAGRLGIVNCLC